MSEAMALIQRAKEIRERLYRPPNAVPDKGINLRRFQPEAPKPEKKKLVIEYQKIAARVYIITPYVIHAPVKRIKIEKIVNVVANYYQLSPSEIYGTCRESRVVIPRHIAIYLCGKYAHRSLSCIGKNINRDHSTVLHAIRNIKDKMTTDLKIVSDILEIERILLK